MGGGGGVEDAVYHGGRGGGSLEDGGQQAVYHGGLCYTSSQVLLARMYDTALVTGHRQACYSCGYDDHDNSDDTDCDDDGDVSDASSTSTNLTVKLNRNYSHHNITRVSTAETNFLTIMMATIMNGKLLIVDDCCWKLCGFFNPAFQISV